MTTRLGIIGGGQLGLYLCEAAQSMAIEVAVFSDSSRDAALHCADRPIVGELTSISAIDELLDGSDVVTFDKEAIPNDTLALLAAAEAQGRIQIHPSVDILMMLKDKALQKTWMQEQGLPTLPFHIVSDGAVPIELAGEEFNAGLVQKSRCGGYDGRGVQILKAQDARQRLWQEPSIVEPFLPNCREISVITVRDRAGKLQTYPPVSMEFDSELNSVTRVSMPADVNAVLCADAIALAESAARKLAGVGVFAIEMFITPKEELLINEISPRVHNSGHVTLDSCNVSQFEQHVRAVTGLPLVAIEAEVPATMLNILYTDAMQQHCPAKPQVNTASETETSIYWYGKEPGIKGRKMGHINAVAATVDLAAAAASRELSKLSSDNSECVA